MNQIERSGLLAHIARLIAKPLIALGWREAPHSYSVGAGDSWELTFDFSTDDNGNWTVSSI